MYRPLPLVEKIMNASLPMAAFVDPRSSNLFVLWKIEGVVKCSSLVCDESDGEIRVVNRNYMNYCKLVTGKEYPLAHFNFVEVSVCMLLPMINVLGVPSIADIGYYKAIDNEWNFLFQPTKESMFCLRNV